MDDTNGHATALELLGVNPNRLRRENEDVSRKSTVTRGIPQTN